MSADPGLKSRVDSLLEQVFSGSVSVGSVVQQLLEERSSAFTVLFAQTTLDEIRFVAKYPPNDLRIAAELTGQLIKFSLISSSHLSVILEAVRRPVSSKLFRFAVVVVEQLLDKIHRFPLFCADLLTVSEFKLTFPRYTSYVASCLDALSPNLRSRETLEEGDVARLKLPTLPDKYDAPLAEREAEESSQSRQRRIATTLTTLTTTVVGAVGAIQNNLSVDLILSDESLLSNISHPSGSVQDQVLAIFNSLSTINTADKAGEIRQILGLSHGEYIPWISLYMTKQRILKEANLHGAYLSLLQNLNHAKFYESMTNATYACLKLLLANADLAITSSQHRTAVKNLGSWLGMITIARDKPLRSKDLDLKQILIDAYESGKLSVIIPLVCKVLQACGASKAYRPPNAWTSGILAVLAELHDVEGLKTNLVFEIEVLGQSLNVNLRDFRRNVSVLGGKKVGEGNNDFVSRPMAPVAALGAAVVAPGALGAGATGAGPAGVRLPLLLPPINPMVAPSIVLFQLQPKLKPLVGIALERAIKEVVVGVIDRSVNIAVLTTKELVLKDFYGEKDKAVVVATAGSTAATLASSLALVTCKEPLKTAISQHLKQCLTGTSATGPGEDIGLIEQVVQIVTQDNLEIAGAVVERVVVERAVREVETQIKAALDAAAAGPGASAADLFQYVGLNWLGVLAPAIKAKPGVVGVYKEFAGVAQGAPQAPGVPPPMVPPPMMPPPPLPPVPPPPPGALPPGPPPGGLVPGGMGPGPMGPGAMGPGGMGPGGLGPVGLLPQGIPGMPAGVVHAPGAVPPGAVPPAGGPPGPSTHAMFQQLKDAAEAVEPSAELGRLLWKLSVELDTLCRDLASSDAVVTLPEVVEAQPVYLDAYYALIGCGPEESSRWLSWLREVFGMMGKEKRWCAVVVHFFVKAINERYEVLGSAIAQENFTCNVTEQHIWFELALACLSLVGVVLGGGGAAGGEANVVLYGPMYALLVYTWHGNLAEATLPETLKQVYMYLGIGLVRYGLVKEPELDKLAVRLFTDFRSIPCTMFVLNYLYLLICKMRMSPISAWSFSMEVISKLGLRVRETGIMNIPLQERPLAERLELFMREGKAVSNLAVDRVLAYRHLHCITVNGPQQLPAELVEFQAVRVENFSTATTLGPSLRLNAVEKRQVVMSLIDQFRLASEEKRKSFWQSLKTAGMQFDSTSLEWSEAVFAGAVFRILQVAGAANPGTPLDYDAIDWMGVFALSLARDAFGDAPAAGDAAKFRVFRKALEAVAKVLTEASLAAASPSGPAATTWRETQVAWGVAAASPSNGAEERICLRLLVVLYSVFSSYRPDSGMWTSGVTAQFSKVLMHLQPRLLPRFALCFLEIVGHREFLPKILGIRGQRGWLAYARLLQAALVSVESVSPGESGTQGQLTRGMLRILLVLLHDFPEFLANYQNVLVSVLPRSAVQIRNLILSAFPKNLKLPDPFQPGLVMRFLPEAKFGSRTLTFGTTASAAMLDLEEAIRRVYRGGALATPTAGDWANIARALKTLAEAGRMDEVVLNVCVLWPAAEKVKTAMDSGAGIVGVVELVAELLSGRVVDAETRYVWISSMSNFLRFPSSHTLFFSDLLTALFLTKTSEETREVILRVLLERLIVHRPHPWGLLVTFVTLIRDPGFWDAVGNSMNPEVEKIFNTVAATCLGAPLPTRP